MKTVAFKEPVLGAHFQTHRRDGKKELRRMTERLSTTVSATPLPGPQSPLAAAADEDAETGLVFVQVLANPILWRSITRFMTGWPLLVKHMYLVNQSIEFSDRQKKETHWSQHKKPGTLPHLAIMENNHRVLSVLYDLYTVPHYNAKPEFSFTRALGCAARWGRLDMLKWLYARMPSHPKWLWGSTKILRNALVLEDLELLDWVYCHCPDKCLVVNPDVQTTYCNVEMVKWLHEHGYKFSPLAMGHAAKRGYLDIVQYLQENVETSRCAGGMDRAARYGHFDLVEYLHHAHAQCTTSTMDAAARAGRLDIVRLLHDERTEGCTTAAMDAAARHGHLHVVQFLHTHRSEGCTTQAIDCAARNGHLNVVKFLHENRTEGCTVSAVDKAAEHGHLQVVEFLLDNRPEGCTKEALFWAVYGGHHKVVRFLCVRRPDLCSDELLDDAAMGSSEQTLAVVCAFSSKGCLFEARARARTWGFSGHEAVLTQFISRDLSSCSLDQHLPNEPRRCEEMPVDQPSKSANAVN